MKKKIFLTLLVLTLVLIVVVAFQNVFTPSSIRFLFFAVTNSFSVILLASALGFLVGFFLMLYASEVRREKETEETDAGDSVDVEPSQTAATPAKPLDPFDNDQEILG